MANFQMSQAVRNAQLDAIETAIGTSPVMRIRTGAQPGSCAASDAGTVLATLTLPSDWMQAAAAGTKGKLGTWEDTAADATGTAGHWRIYDSGGTVCHLQGDVSDTAGSGDLKLQTTAIATGQPVIITAFDVTAGNA